MRVIAGSAKGHKLIAPPGLKVRPTSDRVKEALFSILGEKVNGSVVLDLFAGSGALGIEALSRGATRSVFVDSNRELVQVIKKNLEKTNFQAKAEILESSVAKALDKLVARGDHFDLIFLDPPYKINFTELKGILETLSRERLTKPGGSIILEHSSKVTLLEIDRLITKLSKKYGDTCLTFYSTI
jgi:16S rRNA (guanine(966)-N(2))-methyltransferase RsmD